MFLLFAFQQFHPLGGPADLVGAYATLDEATQVATVPWGVARPVDHDVCEIHELVDGRLVCRAEWHGHWVEIPDAVVPAVGSDRVRP